MATLTNLGLCKQQTFLEPFNLDCQKLSWEFEIKHGHSQMAGK